MLLITFLFFPKYLLNNITIISNYNKYQFQSLFDSI
jgi:hypothetical protein